MLRNFILLIIVAAVILSAGPAVLEFIGDSIDRSLDYEQSQLDSHLTREQRIAVISGYK